MYLVLRPTRTRVGLAGAYTRVRITTYLPCGALVWPRSDYDVRRDNIRIDYTSCLHTQLKSYAGTARRFGQTFGIASSGRILSGIAHAGPQWPAIGRHSRSEATSHAVGMLSVRGILIVGETIP